MKTKDRPKRRVASPAEKEAAKQRRANLKALTKQLEAAGDSGWPVMTIEGHPLSPVNVMLAIHQCPAVKAVGGFRQWRKHGRQVRKGEKGIAIWFPSRTRQEPDGDADGEGEGGGGGDRTFFRVGTVFDISQTEEIQGIETEREEPGNSVEIDAVPDSELLAALTF